MPTVINISSDWLLPGMILPRVAVVIIIITVTVRLAPGVAVPLDLGVVLTALLAGRQGRR